MPWWRRRATSELRSSERSSTGSSYVVMFQQTEQTARRNVAGLVTGPAFDQTLVLGDHEVSRGSRVVG